MRAWTCALWWACPSPGAIGRACWACWDRCGWITPWGWDFGPRARQQVRHGRIRCSDAPRLARRLLEADSVESLRLGEDGRELLVSTRSPATIYKRLPEWVAETDVCIEEFRSTDESLQGLFGSLLRIHRGRS